jgi:hypothetical protein
MLTPPLIRGLMARAFRQSFERDLLLQPLDHFIRDARHPKPSGVDCMSGSLNRLFCYTAVMKAASLSPGLMPSVKLLSHSA